MTRVRRVKVQARYLLPLLNLGSPPDQPPATRQERPAEVAAGGKEEVEMTLSMKSFALVVPAAFALCVLAVTLAVLLVSSLSWADTFGWLTTQPHCGGPCD